MNNARKLVLNKYEEFGEDNFNDDVLSQGIQKRFDEALALAMERLVVQQLLQDLELE